MQKLLIQYLLMPLAKIRGKLPENVWKILAILSVFGICLTQFAYATQIIPQYLLNCVLFCLFLGIFVFCGLSKDIKPVRFSLVMLICWFGVALHLFVTGLLVETNQLGEAMLWLIAFPVCFIVWGNRSAKELADPVIFGAYLSFAVLLLISIFCYPIQSAQYMGFYSNQNSLALYSTAIYALALVDALSQRKFSVRLLLSYVVLGMAAALIMYTNARAGQLSAIIGTIVAFVCLLVCTRKQRILVVTRSFLPIVLSVVLFVSSGVHIFKFGYELPGQIEAMLSATEITEPAATDPVVTDPVVTDPVVTDPAVTDPAVTDPVVTDPVVTDPTEIPTEHPKETIDADKVINDIIDMQGTRQDKVNGDFTEFTSGRIAIWKVYLAEIGILGNPSEKVLYREDGSVLRLSAHMTLLQLAYNAGILAAVLFFVLNIVSGIKALVYVYKGQAEAYTLLPIVVAITYGSYYLVEVVISPVLLLLPFVYLISQTHLMKVEKKEQ